MKWHSKKLILLILPMILIGLLGIWRGKEIKEYVYESIFKSKSSVPDNNSLKSADLKILNNASSDFPIMASAWMRLGTQRSTEARDKALEVLSNASNDPKLIQIAIRVLGYFDEEKANSKLAELLKSTDLQTSRSALQALCIAAKNGSPRENIIRDHFEFKMKKNAKEFKKSPEALMALSSLYRISKEDANRNKALSQMLAFVNDEELSVSQKKLFTNTLRHLAPKDPQVQKLGDSVKLPAAKVKNTKK